jgi:4-hydroxy-4-methyl-2-oxoglutarate aldolase
MSNINVNHIIKYIEDNKISTAEIGDAIGKKHSIINVRPIIENIHIVGKVFYSCGYAESNWPIHNDIVDVKENEIVYIEDLNHNNHRSLFGELVSKYIINTRKAKAIVTNGSIRDYRDIKDASLMLWINGTNPIGSFNTKPTFTDEIEEYVEKQRDKFNGSIAVCDDDGVVIIPKNDINDLLLVNIQKLREQEKIWKECILIDKWSTMDTICLKKYLKGSN